MKRIRYLAAAVLVACVSAPVARADQPSFVPLTAIDFVDPTCGFPVAVHIVLNGETAKVFSNGTIIITGPFSAEWSANGKTVSANISGPAFITPNPDGSVTVVSTGVSGGDLQTANGVTMAVFAGPVSVNATTGLPTLVHGKVLLNICDALAPT